MTDVAELAQRLLQLHKPWHDVAGVRCDHVVLVDSDDVDSDHVCRVGEEACNPEYEEHYALACTECRWATEDGNPAHPLWPCPTARLAADALAPVVNQ